MFDVSQQITSDRVRDLFCTGIEGGYSPWLGKMAYVRIPEGVTERPFYGEAAFWEGDFEFTLTFDGNEDEEGSWASTKTVNRDEIAKALQLMNELYPSHFADFLAETEDADTGDVFLQILCLEDIVYG